jgi:hypothetical protein
MLSITFSLERFLFSFVLNRNLSLQDLVGAFSTAAMDQLSHHHLHLAAVAAALIGCDSAAAAVFDWAHLGRRRLHPGLT